MLVTGCWLLVAGYRKPETSHQKPAAPTHKPITMMSQNFQITRTVTNIIAFVFLILIDAACGSPNEKDHDNGSDVTLKSPGIIFDKPSRMQAFSMGATIDISIRFASPDIKYDSLTVTINNEKQYQKLSSPNSKIKLTTDHTGMQTIRVTVHAPDTTYAESQVVNCFSDIKPTAYKYKVLKKYKHNPEDYTQGLIYSDGFMYEGTGQKGESLLKKYKLENGELMQSYNMPAEDFGEGIVLYKKKIYQLTWQSGVAYEYDSKTFKMINRFVVQTEGWGITNYNDNLIMSDGTNILYVLSPESFDVVKRIEVYDNVGPVSQLNELENINGKIFANVYMTDFIVIIDPGSGRVEGKINMEGLLKQADNSENAEVLNGIAWKGEQNRLLVTGKWWPDLFYVEYF